MVKKSYSDKDVGWAWVVVFGLFVNMFLLLGIVRCTGIIQQRLADYFDVSTTYSSMPVIVTYIVYTIVVPIAIMCAEVLTIRTVIVVGGFIGALGLGLSSLLLSVPWFIICFGICLGIYGGCLYGNCFILLRCYFERRHSLATGITLSGASCGYLIMPLLVEFLLKTYGLGGAMLVLSAIFLHAPVCAALLRPVRDDCQNQMRRSECAEKYEESNSWLNSKSDDNPCSFVQASDEVDCEDKATQSCLHSVINNGFPKSDRKRNDVSGAHHESNKLLSEDEQRDGNDKLVDTLNRKEFETDNSVFDNMSNKGESTLMGSKNNIDSDDESPVTVSIHSTTRRKMSLDCKRIFDISALRNYLSAWFVCGSFFLYYSTANTAIILPGVLEDKGIVGYEMAFILSFQGLGELVSRLTTGVVSDFKFVKRYRLKGVTQILAGINVLFFIFQKPPALYGVQTFLFGCFSGCFNCLFSLVCFDFIETKFMSRTLGLAVQTDGLSVSVGLPVIALMKDLTGSYLAGCVMVCVCSIVGGIMVLLLPVIAKVERRRGRR